MSALRAKDACDILINEFSCITSADNGCDRDCGKCLLVKPSWMIRDALRIGIASIQTLQRIKKVNELGIEDTEVNWMHYGYPSESRKAYQKALDCIEDCEQLHHVFDEAPE